MDYLKFVECLDEEVRESCLDELEAYTKLCSKQEIKEIMKYTILNLRDGLGKDGEKAYKRSYLLLVCAICLDAHKDAKVFTKHDLVDIQTNIIFYTIKEKGFIGFSEYGCLHTLAHLTEVYYRFIELKLVTAPTQLQYLFSMLFSEDVVYQDHEHIRVIRLLNALEFKDLSFLKLEKELDLNNEQDRAIEINYFNFLTQYSHYNNDVKFIIDAHIKKYHPWIDNYNEYDFTLRQSTILDAEIITKAWNNGDIMEGVGFPCGLGITYGDVHDILISQNSRNNFILMIENKGDVLGELSFKPSGDDAEIGIKIYDKAMHGKGIATLVLNKYIDLLFSKRYKRITLDVNKDNISALKLYEKLGFKQKRIEENAFKDQLGRYHDAIYFEKTIN